MRKPTKKQIAQRLFEAERAVLGRAEVLRMALRDVEVDQRTPRLAHALEWAGRAQRDLCEAVDALRKARIA